MSAPGSQPPDAPPSRDPAAIGPVAEGVAGRPADGPQRPPEVGGPPGPEPTRFGDWEKRGRCIDF